MRNATCQGAEECIAFSKHTEWNKALIINTLMQMLKISPEYIVSRRFYPHGAQPMPSNIELLQRLIVNEFG